MKYSINDIKYSNNLWGFNFFNHATMRFFNSRVSKKIHCGKHGVFFVTSEKPPLGHGGIEGQRKYTVRQFMTFSGKIETIGPFYELTHGQAHKIAETLATSGTITINYITSLMGHAEKLTLKGIKQ